MKTQRDKIIEAITSAMGLSLYSEYRNKKVIDLTNRILSIQQEGAKERFGKAMKHLNDPNSDRGVLEKMVVMIQAIEIASGYEPTK